MLGLTLRYEVAPGHDTRCERMLTSARFAGHLGRGVGWRPESCPVVGVGLSIPRLAYLRSGLYRQHIDFETVFRVTGISERTPFLLGLVAFPGRRVAHGQIATSGHES